MMDLFYRWKRARGSVALLALLGLLLVGAGCGGGGGDDDDGPSGTSIRGRIIDSASGQPIQNATVTVGDRSTRSAADGRFSLATPAGTLRVEVSAPNYNPGLYSAVAEANQSTDIGNLGLSSSETGPPAPPL